MNHAALTVAVIQQSFSDKPLENNPRTADLIQQAAASGAELILLPELHGQYYFCQEENEQQFDRAESLDGPTVRFYAELAKSLNVVIVCSIFERRAAGVYHNTAVVLEKTGDIAGTYRKMHIPDDPGYYEKYYFTPGDLGFKPIQTSVGKLGVMVCWDQWFPEAARLMALAGADCLLYPTAIGWYPPDSNEEKQRQYQAWRTIQQAHAIANHIPVLCANRHGIEDPLQNGGSEFWGASFITGTMGEILHSAGHHEDAVLIGQVDKAATERQRRTWPFLRDRRIDAYAPLLSRFR